MARIRLVCIHCVNRNDLTRVNEIDIELDGQKFAGPINIHSDPFLADLVSAKIRRQRLATAGG